jgi:prepilin-type N-terminal cleavage/methylation domain-containing protein
MPRPSPTLRRPRFSRGFTLVELLTVIAVIGILAGILVPTIGVVVQKNRQNRSKTLFSNIVLAFESYKESYGRYPIFQELSAQATPWKTNANEIDYSFGLNDNKAILRQVLMDDPAYQTTASAPGAVNYNRLKINFLQVDDSLLSHDTPGTAQDPVIVDGFGNSDIGVVVHVGSNREIDKDSIIKGVSDAEGNGPLVPKVVRNIPLPIVLYSLTQDQNNDAINSPWVTTWIYGDYKQ